AGLAEHQARRPLQPTLAALPLLEGHKQAEVVQPAGLFLAEFIEWRAQLRRASCLKLFPDPAQQPELELNDPPIGHALAGQRITRYVRFPKQAVLDEEVRANEIQVARERREALVGRIPIAGGTQRQDLPPGLPGADQGIYPGIRRRAKVADTIGPRKRGRVQ